MLWISDALQTKEAVCGSQKLPLHAWTHLAVSYDQASKSLQCFSNGTLLGKVDLPSLTHRQAFPLQLGSTDAETSFLLDEVKLRNYKLSPEAIKQEYERGNTMMVTVRYLNTDGQEVAQTNVLTTANGTPFRLGVHYSFTAPAIPGFSAKAPLTHTVSFQADEQNAKELVFTYTPEYCHHFQSNYAPITKAECQALVDFYESTDGAHWKQATKWRQSRQSENYIPICSWEGVSCDANQSLIKLELPNNNLSGLLLPSFERLTTLQELDLSGNKLRKALAHIQAPALQKLNLSNNQVDEQLPSAFFSQHSELKNLNLSNNRIGGQLSDLSSKLEHLNLSNNRFKGTLPASLANLSALKTLQFTENQFIEPLPESLKAAHFPLLKSFLIGKNYLAHFQKSQTYLALKTKHAVIEKEQKFNTEQYKLVFFDEKGGVLTQKDKLKA